MLGPPPKIASIGPLYVGTHWCDFGLTNVFGSWDNFFSETMVIFQHAGKSRDTSQQISLENVEK